MRRSRLVFLLLITCLVAALSTGDDLFYNLTYLLLAVILSSYAWAWASVNWVQLSRQTRARRAEVGKPIEERFLVRNTGFLPKLWLEVHDHSTLPGHQASRVVHALGARQQWGWMVRTLCRQRGVFTLGPITLRGGDPFGLFDMEKELPHTSTMVVYPAMVNLRAFIPPTGHLPGGGTLHRRTHYVTTNVAGTREYAPGDSFNRIHWPSTARKERLIVKEFELDPTADVWLFLDMERGVHFSLPWEMPIEFREPALLRPRRPRLELAPSTEEYAVTIAASLTRYFLIRDRAVGFVAYTRRREVAQADRGDRQLTRILETLAVIRAEGRIPIAEVLAAESIRLGRGTTIVIITPSADERWVRVTRHLLRRGLQVLAVVIDASTFGGGEEAKRVVAELRAGNTPTYLVRRGEPLAVSLSHLA